MRHVGIYAYRRATLLRYAKMAPTPLERTETLEQLRALENGIVIGVVRRAHGVPIEVDTPEDLAAVRKMLSATPTQTASTASLAAEVRSS
jgi:3-deoxy-manno-octulosonate cytidylyltransferase (CMP-KDO synthetase)